MITRCNQCSAKFEISAELLQAEDTTVRCGECLSVFDARAQLVTEEAPAYLDSSVHNTRSVAVDNVQHSSEGAIAAAASLQQRRAQFSAPVDAQTEAVSSSMADYAHISEGDLEHASTVVLDEMQPAPGGGMPAKEYSQLQHLPSGRLNDGFYSPDLKIDGYKHREARDDAETYADPSGKIDPLIDPVSLDGTGLEFERTLALEGVGARVESPQPGASALPDDVRALDTLLPSADSRSPVPGRSAEPAGGFDATEFAHHPDQAGLPDIPLSGSAAADGYTAIPDDVLSDPPSYEAVEPAQNRDPQHTADNGQPDSASELRRYVNARGGQVFPATQSADDKSGRSGSLVLRLLAVTLLICGALYASRNTVATMNLPVPLLAAFCGVTGCELPVQKNIDQLQLVRHQMAAHPSLDKVLMISVDLINRAPFPQPYPVLVVTMANSEGKSVAFRKFQPEEYLEKEALLKTLPAGKPVRIKFEIVDPGPEALSSELNFE